jgi:hypothetical protein
MNIQSVSNSLTLHVMGRLTDWTSEKRRNVLCKVMFSLKESFSVADNRQSVALLDRFLTKISCGNKPLKGLSGR